MMNYSFGERFRGLMEDYRLMATAQFLVLVPRDSPEHLINNVRTALVASTLGLKNLDHAKRRYVRSALEAPVNVDPNIELYQKCYFTSKKHIQDTVLKLRTENRREPTLGEFGASLVLERLQTSFFSAHLLYRMGQKYEGHAVSRMILEQIAWAYAASKLDDIEKIERLSPTKSVSRLKEMYPDAGTLYGHLSRKTHIDYSSHLEFLTVEEEKNVVLHTQAEFQEYAAVTLHLADVFSFVWEYSQKHYIESFDSLEINQEGQPLLNPARSFITVGDELLQSFVEPSA